MKWIGRPLAEIWPFEISQMTGWSVGRWVVAVGRSSIYFFLHWCHIPGTPLRYRPYRPTQWLKWQNVAGGLRLRPQAPRSRRRRRRGGNGEGVPKMNLVHFTCHRTLLVEGKSNLFIHNYSGTNEQNNKEELVEYKVEIHKWHQHKHLNMSFWSGSLTSSRLYTVSIQSKSRLVAQGCAFIQWYL